MPAAIITETHATPAEIVLSERVVSTEFRIIEIREMISEERVHVEIELGPFVTEEHPGGQTEIRGTSRRGVVVWQNAEYVAVRDTWTNADLLAALVLKLAA